MPWIKLQYGNGCGRRKALLKWIALIGGFLLVLAPMAGNADSSKSFPVRDKYVSFDELTSLARDGDDEAQVTLGTAYAVGGPSHPQDMDKAFYWWTQAANEGNVKAELALGTRYGHGLGVERNMEKAFYWLQKLDTQGDPEGAQTIAYFYEHGSGVPQNYYEAAKWYERAAKLGDGVSQWALGEFYEKGLGVGKDLTEAKKLYGAAAAQGFGGAKRDLERLSSVGQPLVTDAGQGQAPAPTPEKKAEMLGKLSGILDQLSLMEDLQSARCTRAPEVKRKAFQGNRGSIYTLSEMYKNGWCVARDLDRFHMYLEDAAQKGERSAAFDVGFYYEQGSEGYRSNYEKAEQWYKRAIDGGDERAMAQLGDMLLTGKGKKNSVEGLQLLERAAKSETPEISNRALNILALAYLPEGVLPQNIVRARKYALRSSAQCDLVGMLVASASYNQPGALVQAYAWANAAAQHAKENQQRVAMNTRDDLERRMDPAAVAQAQTITESLPVCLPLGQKSLSGTR